jgi:branched-chain amino acid transport system permease protein
MALNIVFGHTNQLYLFIGALSGISAYFTLILATQFAVSTWLTAPISALLVGLIGLIVSYVAARRRFTVIIIAILTLSLQLAAIEVFIGARDLTGGTTGRPFDGLGLGILQDALGLNPEVALYYVLLAVLLAVLVFYDWMRRGTLGLAFEMIRQDEIAAETVGINVVRYKSIAGFIGAFIIGLAGPFYGKLQGLLLPGMFQFATIDVLVLIILMVGGIRTLVGPLLGAGLMIYLGELLQEAGQWRLILFGGILVILFLYFRQGLVPYIARQLRPIVESIADTRAETDR